MRTNRQKEIWRKASNKYYYKNRDKIAKRKAEYRKRNKRKLNTYASKYSQEQYKKNKKERNKEYFKKIKVRRYSRYHISKKLTCEKCDKKAKRLEFHHKDYNNPFEVVTLCTKCHKQEHSKNAY